MTQKEEREVLPPQQEDRGLGEAAPGMRAQGLLVENGGSSKPFLFLGPWQVLERWRGQVAPWQVASVSP